jgi:ankyrin repeat protein
MKNHVPLIRLLVASKANIEAVDSQHCTPIHLACKKGSYESIAVLLAHGANIFAIDER